MLHAGHDDLRRGFQEAARRTAGWHFRRAIERDEIGPNLLLEACEFGLEGMVYKRADRPYRAGVEALDEGGKTANIPPWSG